MDATGLNICEPFVKTSHELSVLAQLVEFLWSHQNRSGPPILRYDDRPMRLLEIPYDPGRMSFEFP